MHRSRFAIFSESLGASLAPLLAPLNDRQLLGEAPQSAESSKISQSLGSIRTLLEETLAEASERRPHIVIAGPPKSGKSTLMVALARSYVTKVSDLPSLPAPVRVVHAPSWSLTLIRHDGTSSSYSDPSSARIEVQRAHRVWIEAKRAAESLGVPFEAHESAPRAPQWVELRTPAVGLSESRIALVELPSLFNLSETDRERMEEFYRDEASSVVLVVRGEDFSRPQCMEEFEHFIAPGQSAFLVLNLDPYKVDLGPDGDQLPTLDHDDPVSIIRAFQSQGASKAWLDAFDNGRLRVHLAPLFDLAAMRLTDPEDSQTRAHSLQRAAGRRLMTPDPQEEQDPLIALENELDTSLHEGQNWRSHVQETLHGVDVALDELQAVLGQAKAFSQANSTESQSKQQGLVALERARTAMQQLRAHHLAED